MSAIHKNVTVDLSQTIGQVFISAVLTTGLWGVSYLQLLFYLRTYTTDHWAFRGYVVLLWMLSTLHEIFGIRAQWTLLIGSFGDLAALIENPPDLILAILVSCIVGFMAQGFFIWRIWRFSRYNWFFPIVLVPLSLLAWVAGLVYGGIAWNQTVAIFATAGMTRLSLLIAITITLVDVSIAVIMIVLLYKGRTGFTRSNTLIVRLIYSSIATGSCAAVFGFLSAVTLAWPKTLLSALGANTICAVYCNTVLANLNARQYIGTIQKHDPSSLTDVVFKSRPIELGSIQQSGVREQSGSSTEGGYTGSKIESVGDKIPAQESV